MNITLSNPFIIIFLIGTIGSFLLDQVLEFIDYRARQKNGGMIPPEIAAIPASKTFDTQRLSKICSYENDKYFCWIPSAILGLCLTMVLVFSGFYPWLFGIICSWTGFPQGWVSTCVSSLLFLILSGVPSSIIGIPFGLYREFVIEKRYGFSKMTLGLWLTDMIKGMILSTILAAILIAVMSILIITFPTLWWIFVTAVMFVFTIIMQVIYPLIIAPMFNKFTPLEDGELKDKITALMEHLGFRSNGIFVMDASKRSGHSNAYFGGLGKSKRIVLYDTLISQLTTDELVAVLGHELGHYKLHHITRKLLIMIPMELLLMFVLYKCATAVSLYSGFGFNLSQDQVMNVQIIGFFLANIVFGDWGDLFTPITKFFSRRDEFAADRFSAKLTGNAESLCSALVKLNSENLSELLPPKIYVLWNYDHPTLTERVKALKETVQH